ncbi:hemolysin D [Photobacterium jeanii]|uniref:Hemolysin D n=1 Tax=Photobacterium jeanii TaxID=858640 RepID=A0A178K163_9GAMM|nr:type VI secretion system tube protein Hcp [Photobacterium jeanii]OAN11069.1 hemolysin D [Photobacterium jeanii]PST90583.1 Hcp1 family type VI secretion system effector [Photobacterium jeanii]
MQSNTYMYYNGIKGEGTGQEGGTYDGLITVLSVDWGVGREITSFTGTAKDREASAARLYDMTVTKLQDSASTLLFKEATTGKSAEARFHITKQGEDGIEDIITYVLTDAMISAYSISVQDDRPIETLTISFTEMELKVWPTSDQNIKQGHSTYKYSGKHTIGKVG